MKSLLRFSLILSLIFSFSNLFAQQQAKPKADIGKLALEFMHAYSDWDTDKMGNYYDDAVHFEDPTANDAFNNGSDVTGKDSVLKFIKAIFKEKTDFVRFDVKSHFVSKNYVVVQSLFETIIPQAWLGPKGSEFGKVFISIPVTTVLHFKDDKIIEHIDYADYNTYLKQIRLQTTK